MNDAFQGMLFGATSADDEGSADGRVEELRLCALNVKSPNPSRAQHIVNWLLGTKSNTLVLSEMQPSEGGRYILACLQAEGFTTICTPGWKDSRYLTVVATRGLDSTPVQPAAFDLRIAAVDLTTDDSTVRVVGIYGPTNGMTAGSSARRREFQGRLLDYLATITHPALCVAGDLNVVEPDLDEHLVPIPLRARHRLRSPAARVRPPVRRVAAGRCCNQFAWSVVRRGDSVVRCHRELMMAAEPLAGRLVRGVIGRAGIRDGVCRWGGPIGVRPHEVIARLLER